METTFPDPSNASPESTTSPQPPIDMDALSQEALDVLGNLLQMLSFQATLTPQVQEKNIHIRLECEDAGRLIGRRGSTINEIQFLLNRILQRRHKFVPRVFLDVNGPQEKPAAEPSGVDGEFLTGIRSSISQVRRWGEPVELGPLNPVERQAVQDLLARDREVEVVPQEAGADSSGLQKMRLQARGA